jgi:hypothetical protein
MMCKFNSQELYFVMILIVLEIPRSRIWIEVLKKEKKTGT